MARFLSLFPCGRDGDDKVFLQFARIPEKRFPGWIYPGFVVVCILDFAAGAVEIGLRLAGDMAMNAGLAIIIVAYLGQDRIQALQLHLDIHHLWLGHHLNGDGGDGGAFHHGEIRNGLDEHQEF